MQEKNDFLQYSGNKVLQESIFFRIFASNLKDSQFANLGGYEKAVFLPPKSP